ncbi:hypothetical protein ACFQ6B_06125 [Streptomyces wedmorensis]|uniref:Uncharacterized protein n=1 Tax=Streptomyces wedmorensis TaxID=43759 RepID=A0ABW6IZJ1_STRWE
MQSPPLPPAATTTTGTASTPTPTPTLVPGAAPRPAPVPMPTPVPVPLPAPTPVPAQTQVSAPAPVPADPPIYRDVFSLWASHGRTLPGRRDQEWIRLAAGPVWADRTVRVSGTLVRQGDAR